MKSFARPAGWIWFLLALVAPMAWLSPALLHRAPSFRDQGDFFYPMKLYTAGRLRAGDIPLWNPLSGAGEPWLANLQSGVFYPPTAFFLLPSAALAAALFLLVHFALGAWGTWRFLKDESVSDAGALLGAGLYTGSGFAASLSPFWNHFGAWAYLPGIAWLARSGLRSRSSRLGFALLVGLQAMAGSPELSAASLVVAVALVLAARPVAQTGWHEPHGGRRLGRVLASGALGLAIAGWALVPFAELLLHSDRQRPLPAVERESGVVSAAALGSFLGVSAASSGTSYLSSLYVGPIAVAAALAALLEKQRRRLVILLVAAALVALLFALAAPPGTWLRQLPPLDRIRYPAKALTVSFFALSVLAGLGLDTLRFAQVGERRLAVVAWIVAAVITIAIVISPLPVPVRVLSGAGVAALLGLAVGRFRVGRSLLSAAVAGTLLASLFFANRRLFRFVEETELTREPESVRFLARLPGRVLTPPMMDLVPWVLADSRFDAETLRRQREALLGYTNLLVGVRTVRTAAALPTRAARRIADTIDTAQDLEAAATSVSARLFWSPFAPSRLGSRKVGEFFRAPLNPYRGRLSVVSGYRVEPRPEQAWSDVAEGRVDWRLATVLDREPVPRPGHNAARTITIASILEDLPERLVARVHMNDVGILVVTDLAYPGWKAEVDGRSVPLLRADGYFRAVALPEGDHRVVFQYRPFSVYAGGALTAAALILWLVLAWSGEPSGIETLL